MLLAKTPDSNILSKSCSRPLYPHQLMRFQCCQTWARRCIGLRRIYNSSILRSKLAKLLLMQIIFQIAFWRIGCLLVQVKMKKTRKWICFRKSSELYKKPKKHPSKNGSNLLSTAQEKASAHNALLLNDLQASVTVVFLPTSLTQVTSP